MIKIGITILSLFFCNIIYAESSLGSLNENVIFKGYKYQVITDKTEDEESLSMLKVSNISVGNKKIMRLSVNLKKNINLGYQYAEWFLFTPENQKDVSMYNSVYIELKVDNPIKSLIFFIRAVDDNNRKRDYGVVLDKKISKTGKWLKLKILLSDLYVLKGIAKGKILPTKNIIGLGFRMEAPCIANIDIKSIKFGGQRVEPAPALNMNDIDMSEYPNYYFVATFDNGTDPTTCGGITGVASDKEEKFSSKTVVMGSYYNFDKNNVFRGKGYSYMFKYNVEQNKDLGYQYGAVFFTTPNINPLKYKYLSFRIKGDWKNMNIIIKDNNNEKYIVDLNKYFRTENDWTLVTIALDRFFNKQGEAIKGMISSISLSQTEIGEGKVFIDEIFLWGKREKSKIKYNIKSISRIESTEEEGLKMSQTMAVKINSRIQKMKVTGEIYFDTRGFSKAMWTRDTDNRLVPQDIKGTELLVTVNNLNAYIPLFRTLKIGKIDINYNGYTIYKKWFYEGIKLEGRKGLNNYDIFYLKNWNDSFTGGARLISLIKGFKFDLVDVFVHRTGNISTTEDVESVTVYNENTTTAEVSYNLGIGIRLIGFYGYMTKKNFYNSPEVDADGVIYGEKLNNAEKLDDTAAMITAKFFDLLFPGLKVYITYKNIGADFKPTHRDLNDDDRGFFDINEVKGEVRQRIFRPLYLTGSYSKFGKISIPLLRGYSYSCGFEVYNFKHIDISSSYGYKNEYNYLLEQRRIEKNVSFTIGVGSWFGLQMRTKMRFGDIRFYRNDTSGNEEQYGGWIANRIKSELSYNVNSAMVVYMEYEKTVPDDYYVYYNPKIWDNYFRIRLEINF